MNNYPRLTKKQVTRLLELTNSSKHWSEKKKHCLGAIRSFYQDITEDQLEDYLEYFLPAEVARQKREFYHKSLTGEIISEYTPTRLTTGHQLVQDFIIGHKYHVSWMYVGAVFVLKALDRDGEHCFLDNPKHKRDSLLHVKLSDLRTLSK